MIKKTKNFQLLFGMILLTIILGLAIFGPMISSRSYEITNLPLKNRPPASLFWFGTDELGRDVFIRCLYGARISLTVGILAAVIDLFIGAFFGLLSGFSSKKIDNLIMRTCDILQGIPYILMVIMLLVLLGQGIITLLIALTLTGWINMARIVRGQVLQTKKNPYILSAKTLGAGFFRILFIHILPNIYSTILATIMITVPSAIFTEAFLSFLGLGIQAPVASLGVMIHDSLTAMCYYPWRLFFPAFFICVTLLGFHLLGEGIKKSCKRV